MRCLRYEMSKIEGTLATRWRYDLTTRVDRRETKIGPRSRARESPAFVGVQERWQMLVSWLQRRKLLRGNTSTSLPVASFRSPDSFVGRWRSRSRQALVWGPRGWWNASSRSASVRSLHRQDPSQILGVHLSPPCTFCRVCGEFSARDG